MSFLAGQTLILCIVLNLFIPFFIVYFLTNKFTPKSYFVYGMAVVITWLANHYIFPNTAKRKRV